MKILLIGEYSRFHNSLKKGLQQLGHQVTLIGDGDQFKNFPVDISTKPVWFSKYYIPRKFKNGLYTLTKIDLLKVEQGLRYYLLRKKLRGFDAVQLINSDALFTYPWLAKPTLSFIFKNNKNVFLSACGDDTPFVQWMLSQNKSYDLLYAFKQNWVTKEYFKYTLKYTKPAFKNQYEFIKQHVKAIIPSDLDYHISLKDNEKVTPLVPTPIDVETTQISKLPPTDVIHIFHGINTHNYYKKGNNFFEDALKVVSETYGKSIKITTARSLPYDEYIKAYDSAHILLDQVYSYDQGYNALEAMAKGKVVFSGAETVFYEHYKLTETVCINAKPDVEYLIEQLNFLINNPAELKMIGQRAKEFVKKHHNIETVASKYVGIYNS